MDIRQHRKDKNHSAGTQALVTQNAIHCGKVNTLHASWKDNANEGQKGHIGQNGSLENRIDCFLHACQCKGLVQTRTLKQACNCSGTKMPMDRQRHWDTRLEHPMKRYTNRPAHLQPTTDEDLVKTQQKSTTPKANQLTEGVLLKAKALF